MDRSTMECPACGAELAEGQAYCRACLTVIASPGTEAAAAASQRSRALIVGAAVLVVLAVVATVAIFHKPQHEETVSVSPTSSTSTSRPGTSSTSSSSAPASTSTSTQHESSSSTAASTTSPPPSSSDGPSDVVPLRPAKLPPADRSPLAPGEVVANNGVGPYLIGETRQDLESVPGLSWSVVSSGTSGDYPCVNLEANLGGRGMLALVVGDRVAVLVVDTAGYRTKSGIGVGSTSDELHAAYPKLRALDHGAESDEVWLFEPTSPDEQNYVVAFFLRGGQVVETRSGIRRYVTDVQDFCGIYVGD